MPVDKSQWGMENRDSSACSMARVQTDCWRRRSTEGCLIGSPGLSEMEQGVLGCWYHGPQSSTGSNSPSWPGVGAQCLVFEGYVSIAWMGEKQAQQMSTMWPIQWELEDYKQCMVGWSIKAEKMRNHWRNERWFLEWARHLTACIMMQENGLHLWGLRFEVWSWKQKAF